MGQEPCSVCGAKDLNLIDGYYYCVECGTQDLNARETVVEIKQLTDGALGNITTTKIKIAKDIIEMSPEWMRWHAFNFILSGLGDELVALGAGDGFKMRLLHIWAQYMKKCYIKEDVLSQSQIKEFYEEDVNKENVDTLKEMSKTRQSDLHRSITYPLLFSMLYVALNLEKSDILLSHLQRFTVEGRISSSDCTKHVPKDLKVVSIPGWGTFMLSCSNFEPESTLATIRVRKTALAAMKKLNLGTPVVPDLRKIVDTCIKELCLPNDFKNLVFSLMELVPCDHLCLHTKTWDGLVRLPDYEGTVMAYVVVALKLCFGLDDSYDAKLSKEVEKINKEENRPKSYKLGLYSDGTDRLFCFKEWCYFLELRKMILSKHYGPIAHKTGLPIDDYVFMEHSKERPIKKKTLHEEIIMEILDKIHMNNDHVVIPKSEFVDSLTPLTTYIDIILQYYQDPDIRLHLAEDFTQYSIKYACQDLKLPTNDDLFTGVRKKSFIIDDDFYFEKTKEKFDMRMVYIKSCENKNWLTTKQPKTKHVRQVVEDSENDHGYDSNQENTKECTDTYDSDAERENDEVLSYISSLPDNSEVEVFSVLLEEPETVKIETINEEEGNIFDDDFADLDDIKKEIIDDDGPSLTGNGMDNNQSLNDYGLDNNQSMNENEVDNNETKTEINNSIDEYDNFDPETFNREDVIKELVLAACREYKTGRPPEYRLPVNRKRKPDDEAQEIRKRKKICDELVTKTNPGEAKKEMERILAAYHENFQRGLLRTAVQGIFRPENDINNEFSDDRNIENEPNNTYFNEINELDATDSSCIFEGSIQNEDNILQIDKNDPRYDEKIHDIRQLYLKFKDKFDIDDILQPDLEIEKVIDRQIDKKLQEDLDESITNQEASIENQEEGIGAIETHAKSDWSDDEDDNIPLDKIKSTIEKSNVKNPCKDFLISRETKVKTFKYWLRSYTTLKKLGFNTKFYEDLRKEFPKSFHFVLQECALVINSSPLILYQLVQNLELRLKAIR